MNIATVLAVKQQQVEDSLRQMEKQQLVHQALMARRQKAKATQPLQKTWQQIMALVLPG